jgi:hypothetical protein
MMWDNTASPVERATACATNVMQEMPFSTRQSAAHSAESARKKT